MIAANEICLAKVTFDSNNADQSGGAIYMASADITNPVVYRESTFEHNSATNGGAIYVVADEKGLVVEDSELTNNRAGMNNHICLRFRCSRV